MNRDEVLEAIESWPDDERIQLVQGLLDQLRDQDSEKTTQQVATWLSPKTAARALSKRLQFVVERMMADDCPDDMHPPSLARLDVAFREQPGQTEILVQREHPSALGL